MCVCVCVYSIHVRCDQALICDLPPDQGDLDGMMCFFEGGGASWIKMSGMAGRFGTAVLPVI